MAGEIVVTAVYGDDIRTFVLARAFWAREYEHWQLLYNGEVVTAFHYHNGMHTCGYNKSGEYTVDDYGILAGIIYDHKMQIDNAHR